MIGCKTHVKTCRPSWNDWTMVPSAASLASEVPSTKSTYLAVRAATNVCGQRRPHLPPLPVLASMPLRPFLHCGALPPPSAPSLAPQRDEAAASASARTVRLQTYLAIEITSDLLLVAQLDVHGPLVQVQLLRWDTITASEGRVILPCVSEQRVEDLV